MGGDLGTLLGADAHQPLLGEVLGHPHQVRARRAARCRPARRARPAGRRRGARRSRCTTMKPVTPAPTSSDPGRRRGPAAAAPARGRPRSSGPGGRCPPGARPGRRRRRRAAAARVAVGVRRISTLPTKIMAPTTQREQGDDLALVGALPASQERPSRGSLRLGDAADAERHEEPEDGVQQRAEAVEDGSTRNSEPHPEHGQPEVPGEPARDAADQPAVGAAVELAHPGVAGLRRVQEGRAGAPARRVPAARTAGQSVRAPPPGRSRVRPGRGALADIPRSSHVRPRPGHQGRSPKGCPG